MKINQCQHIKPNGKICNAILTGKQQFCKACIKKRRCASTKKWVDKNKKEWKPYTKNCKYCNAIIEVNHYSQGKREYCNNECSKKYISENKKQQRKIDKIGYKMTPCVCPKCNCNHKMELFWTGKLPARKHCESCKLSLLHIDDLMIGGYAVGYY